jgi:hypothetical protein
MEMNIDNLGKGFFKKSVSVGHHNIKYSWAQITLMIMNCVKCLETFEEGAKSPSAQTIRDRLLLDGKWHEYCHDSLWKIAAWLAKRWPRMKWHISVDETYIPFFGKRDRLNEKLVKQGAGRLVHGYTAKTNGATGSFCFLVISLCCSKIRLPIAIKMMQIGEKYEPWLKPILRKLLKLAPKSIILADRGFGKATWFYLMLDELKAKYVVRAILRKDENKNKVANGAKKFMHWMTETETNKKVLISVRVEKDSQERVYFLATNLDEKRNKEVLAIYLNRWDIENIFKDTDRVELKTSSTNPKMKLFAVIVSFFLFALWQAKRLQKNAVCSLRRFVKQIVQALCELLKIILTPLGVLMPKPPG